ncbi:PREDICTED: (6-4)DNA photolyase-like [Nicotiana attenuata]|uniref:(6-4)DNA photolyase-like n=1 Tax=Nicotiana attenuata TaxID=49451 RepID=UPI0009058484|nr:PREDICTED: (6-4)DNA photolyase-like [Nicotiana attenuata]
MLLYQEYVMLTRGKLCFEYDTEPYYQALDVKVKNHASVAGVEIFSPVSHTFYNPAASCNVPTIFLLKKKDQKEEQKPHM